jgi:hypothetical protein
MKLPPGTYFIGDPCYVFDNDRDTWDRLLTVQGFGDGKVVEFEGHQLWAASTKYGDGTYRDQNGAEYGVDSGMLGAVPIELIESPVGEEDGRMIEAPNGLTVSEENGTFYLGNTVIETDDFDED